VPATITFHGGAGTVTGSRFLISAAGSSVLIECGLFQGLKALRLQNWEGPGFPPTAPGAIILTHAHIDHAGYLPRLVQLGYRGPVYTTPATAEMARILLPDAAQIQEEDAAYANRKGFSKHRPALPLYTVNDALRALQLFRTRPYGERFDVEPFRVTFRNAGHILGSAFVQLEVPLGDSSAHRVVVSGDLGRYHQPLHTDPAPLPACDTLLLESTYGNRTHSHEPIVTQLREQLIPTLERGGIVLIPAFAVARAQLVTYHLRQAIESGRFPDVPIHIDSPMANDVTGLYSRYLESEYLDRDIPHTATRALFPRNVRFHRTIEDSKKLNNLAGPRIIIAASGMLTGGRVLHHLQRLAPDQRNLLCLVGYQAAGTRGRALLEGAPTVRVFGLDVEVRARVTVLHGLSAHADRDELIRWVQSAPEPPRRIFLVHGEPPALEALADELRQRVPSEITIPALGDTFGLD
jgi:metallo-beta-lactamase family protein